MFERDFCCSATATDLRGGSLVDVDRRLSLLRAYLAAVMARCFGCRCACGLGLICRCACGLSLLGRCDVLFDYAAG